LETGRRRCGQCGRTNGEAIRQLREIASPFGYAVHAVPFTGCLHLETAVTAVGPHTLVLDPEWVDPETFARFARGSPCIPASRSLPPPRWSAAPASFPPRFRRPGAHWRPGRASAARGVRELAKADAGPTRCSVLVDPGRGENDRPADEIIQPPGRQAN
jgi:dimethylargininase